jgi:outer membrane protein insertion porin family
MHISRVAIFAVASLIVGAVTPVKVGNARSLAAQNQANQPDISPVTATLAMQKGGGEYVLPSERRYQVVYDGGFLRMGDERDRINPTPNPNSQASINAAFLSTNTLVRTIEIRFVNNKGNSVDRDGKPILGRLSREYITSELKLKPGEAFSEDVIRADLQQLKQLGLFERVDVSVAPADDGVDVVYNIQERSARSVNFGGGYNDDLGVFGTISYQDFTLGRTHQRVEGKTQVSLENIDFDARFISPYRAAEPHSLGYGVRVFRERTVSNIFNRGINLPSPNNNDGDRVRELRLGASVTATRPIEQAWGTLGLNVTRLSTRDRKGNIARVDEQGNTLSFSGTGIDDLYTVSFAVTRDWRDNPFNPTRGALLSLSTEQSIPIGVGNILQNRLVGNYIHYVPVRWFSSDEENAKRDVFPEMLAFNVQAGTVIGDMPPIQAFRLGGINSVRGYEEGDLGSGRSYILASGEYRFPVFSGVGGVIFADLASDLGSGNTVPGQPAIVRDKPGTGFGTGVGARWRSPFGILRLDLGINNQGDVRFYTEFGTGLRF